MGFDDLKTTRSALFLRSVAEGRQLAHSAVDVWLAATVIETTLESAASDRSVDVAHVAA